MTGAEDQPTATELTKYSRRLREYNDQLATAIELGRAFTQVNHEAAESVRELQAALDQFGDRGGLVVALKETRDVLGEFNANVDRLDALANGEAPGR